VKNIDADKRDERLGQFLERQSDVISGITPKWFTALDELREQVKKSVQVWLQDYLVRRPGDASATFAEFADDILAPPSCRARVPRGQGATRRKRSRLASGFWRHKTALAATLWRW
jgi:hypothetical protein